MNIRPRGLLLILALLLSLIVIAGCAQQNQPTNAGQTGQTQTGGLGSTGSQQGQTTGAKTYDVDIQGFAFNPAELNIKTGDTVTWTNKDSVSHTVTSDSGGELASDTLSNGQTYSHTFNQAGTFSYHCSIHLSMKAKVVVS